MNKKLTSNDLLGLHEILATYTKVPNKISKLLVFMNKPDTEPIIGYMIKYASDISEVFRPKFSITIKALRIYQYWITYICNVLLQIDLGFEILQSFKSLTQSVI